MPLLEKWCNGCKRTLPESAFSRHKSGDRQGSLRARCKECDIVAAKKWQRANRDRMLAQKTAYRAAHPEETRRYQRRKNWRVMGLDPDEVESLLERNEGRCMICGVQEKLVPDHDHETLELRGVLCHWCNTGLGMFRDDPSSLAAAIVYLKGA